MNFFYQSTTKVDVRHAALPYSGSEYEKPKMSKDTITRVQVL